MKKLHDAVDRFALRHPRFGVPGLIRYITVGTAIVYALCLFSSYYPFSFLSFDWGRILHGEVWRLVSFVFLPSTTRPLSLVLSLYFSYFIGTLLEREWGTAKFSLYYFSGVALTVLTGIIGHYAFGSSAIYGAYYVNMAMFFAFAALYPDMQVLLFWIFPIKVKWIALLDALLFAFDTLAALLQLNFLGALLPVVALLNFFIFFWTDLQENVLYHRRRAQHRNSHQTIQFKSAVRQQQKRDADRGYRHKCAVCGRTDADFPDLEFRYCSRCAGYHCFCSDHIFNHVHFTTE